jgi:tetratricopeptide (TPR) repeat protein
MNFEEIESLMIQGNHLKVINLLESKLSETTQNPDLIDTLIKSYNEHALSLLSQNHLSPALEFLKKAESFTEIDSELRSRTLNNIACCYKAQNKQTLALRYIEKALFLYPSGDFHLNKCAILSMSGKHQQALEEAMFAVIYLQEELMELLINNSPLDSKKFEALAISYHNLAVELEFLRKIPQSISFYSKAINLSEKFFSSETKLKEKLENDMQMALKSSQKVIKKQDALGPYSKKKRIIIRNANSKSPVLRNITPIRTSKENKEIVKRPLARKFVSTGVSKVKMMEMRKTNVSGFEGISEAESDNFMKTERIFVKSPKEKRDGELNKDLIEGNEDSGNIKENVGKDKSGEDGNCLNKNENEDSESRKKVETLDEEKSLGFKKSKHSSGC